MAKKGGNIKNIEKHKFTAETARIAGAKGGRATGIAKRRRKTVKEMLLAMLEMPNTEKSSEKLMDKMGIEKTEQNNQAAVLAALMIRAKAGDVRATEQIVQFIGEKIEKAELDTKLTIEDYFKDKKLDL